MFIDFGFRILDFNRHSSLDIRHSLTVSSSADRDLSASTSGRQLEKRRENDHLCRRLSANRRHSRCRRPSPKSPQTYTECRQRRFDVDSAAREFVALGSSSRRAHTKRSPARSGPSWGIATTCGSAGRMTVAVMKLSRRRGALRCLSSQPHDDPPCAAWGR